VSGGISLREKAVIDANINRVGEGLRVVEDWSRFCLRDTGLTEKLRNIRHGLWKLVEKQYPDIIKGRSSGEDILAGIREPERARVEDIPRASFNRAKEGLRVLEEMGKLISSESSAEFKKMRFSLYEIEREFYERCP